MKAMLLAAGRGVRMGGLTADRPKPLLSLGAETLIERQLRLLRRAGVREVVMNISYHGVLIREMLGDGRRYGVEIVYSEEGEPPLETAGGIVRALPLLGNEPFIVANSDIVTNFDYAQLTRAAAANLGELLGTLVLVPNPAHHTAGDFGIDAGGLACTGGERLTYAGIALLHPELFAGHAAVRAPLRPIFDSAIETRRLGAIAFDGLWIDVGTPERLDAARNLPPHI
jgi:N-acetyl-alpha-D-muramate 1-phosphate uridylyltransferase